LQGSFDATPEESAVIAHLTTKTNIIPLEPENAQEAGFIQRSLRKRGMPISVADCLLAGIVVSGNANLLTRNVRDFSRVEGLILETY
jgi:tRNA(fMet)-specific endonuclease VapC